MSVNVVFSMGTVSPPATVPLGGVAFATGAPAAIIEPLSVSLTAGIAAVLVGAVLAPLAGKVPDRVMVGTAPWMAA